jgi:hypothetical protein
VTIRARPRGRLGATAEGPSRRGAKPIYVYNAYTCVYYENRRSISSIGNIVHMTDVSRLVILERPPNPISRVSKRRGTKICVEPLQSRWCSRRAPAAGQRSDQILICDLIAPSAHHENVLNFNSKSPNFDRFNRSDSMINRLGLILHCSSIIIKYKYI